ncbi:MULTISPECIES: type II toxin-antitoxin system RelB/DinJ family antitoxin [unclassified Bifidobacterium]|uniref:type II toxin-antitoxin system RelB/DinJ family antitoxin n=1 Tax=unclassified Bifidobacterium TaxID=2608897 RepID=UPI0023F77C14|nr:MULTISPECIES: type II toxin-antitoxin system RelB/DinJ family antitoxin [unclassified Bifidobacterium]WEV65597.1 type II toxin-antitoxin system RelB/DinJ family antitoxin [Bifidobacterium sp. ESL0764]WEV75602.1 type II toxin-antitoxin system RelB/DinJ family antitoxin [Bifidobacterium sp. ESL0800]
MSNAASSPVSRVQLRMDSGLKEKGERLFRSMGLDFSSAVNMFVAQAVREQRIPFQPSAQTSFERSVLATEDEPLSEPMSLEEVKSRIRHV